MIAMLTGTLAYRRPDQIIVDVAGVGYRLQVPLSTFYSLPDEGQISLHVHTHVKEDALQLYGFSTITEKDLFLLLVSVSGVGPRLALTILSHAPVEELALALIQADITRLTAIPGIGKKSAERLVLELQDKATTYAANAAVSSSGKNISDRDDIHQDALSALINLGYKENLARRALRSLNPEPETALEDVLKSALQILLK